MGVPSFRLRISRTVNAGSLRDKYTWPCPALLPSAKPLREWFMSSLMSTCLQHEAVLTIAAPGLANRAPTTKKYTTEGLRAVERSLLEEKAEMEKELEELRRAVEKLRASNREMQMSLEKTKPPVTDAKANDTTQLSDSSFPNAHQPKRREFLLPDLNELPCSD